MFEFAWPWLFVLLPLPWLAARMLAPATTDASAALRLPIVLAGFDLAGGANPVARWKRWLALIAWALLIAAAARPQWIGEPIDLARSGRDLMLIVDASGSMDTPDMRIGGQDVTRYGAVKAIAGDFVRRRVGDRLGLIVFGSQAYLLTPLTFDRDTVGKQLGESVVGLPGRETAIGDAVGLAVKRLRERPADQRVAILLTDGVNDAGELDPLKAIDLAVAEKVKVYTIGIGAEAMRINDGFFGSRVVNPSAEIDEKMLADMAQKTGGRYFRARDTAELAKIYEDIDRLEPSADKGQQFRPIDELFFWPLSAALLLALFGAIVPLVAGRFAMRADRVGRAAA
ncbi:MAG: VWA domain-containing protein [Rudaea sp.]|uniref:VWA domain-containing protein n=1 Tax=unclassified Rudaea TaxID=2627037 RepID=UPI0010F8805B|nr:MULTISPECIES: VWA domain-containing protein [unclassified Rudaea]MBN8885985.1 VWA domain-containing protein [Rudaea sp.]